MKHYRLTRPYSEAVLRRFIFIALLIFTFSNTSFARDFYVATNGNDRNSGTIDQPLRSIQRGLQIAQKPGDRVVIRKGLYQPSRTILLPNSGSNKRFIELKAHSNEKVIIDGKNLDKNSRSLLAILNHHIRITGLTIQNSRGSGISVYGPGERIHDVELIGNEIKDSFESGIQIGWNQPKNAPLAIIVDGNSIHHNNRKNQPNPGAAISEKARLLGGRAIPWGSAISGVSRGLIVRNNKVFNNWGEGIGVYLADDIKIEGNTVSDNFSVNIYLDNTTNSVVERNFVYSTGDKDFYRHGHPASGIQIANENYGGLTNRSNNNTIINNILIDNYFAFYVANYQQGGGMKNTLFANNTCCGSTRSLLRIDADKGHTNSRIVNNIFQQKPGSNLADVGGSTNGITFQTNLWYGGPLFPNVRSRSDLNAHPNFINSNSKKADDFKLKPNSPALGTGSRVDEVKNNFANQKHSGKTNLGAW